MFIALKPCSFGAGKDYLIGDQIPDQVVSPDAVARLTKLGIIGKANGQEPTQGATGAELTALLHVNGEEDIPLHLTPADVRDIFSILQRTPKEAAAIVERMTNPEALTLLHASESRKTVREAAEQRAQELEEAAEVEGPDPQEEAAEEGEGDR